MVPELFGAPQNDTCFVHASSLKNKCQKGRKLLFSALILLSTKHSAWHKHLQYNVSKSTGQFYCFIDSVYMLRSLGFGLTADKNMSKGLKIKTL